MGLLRALSSEILKTSKNRDSTTSLGNLLYCLTVFMGKKFLVTLSLKVSFIGLSLLPLIQLSAKIRAWLCLLSNSPQTPGSTLRSSCTHLFPLLNKPWFHSFSLQKKCSSPNCPGEPSLTCPSLQLSFHTWGSKTDCTIIDAVQWVLSKVQGNPSTVPTVCASVDSSMHSAGHLCCQGTLLTQVQPAVPQSSQGFSAELFTSPSVPNSHCCQRVLYHQPWFDCLSIGILTPLRSPREPEKYDRIYSKPALFWSSRWKGRKKAPQMSLDIYVWFRSIYSLELNRLPAQLSSTSLSTIVIIYQWESDRHIMKNVPCSACKGRDNIFMPGGLWKSNLNDKLCRNIKQCNL